MSVACSAVLKISDIFSHINSCFSIRQNSYPDVVYLDRLGPSGKHFLILIIPRLFMSFFFLPICQIHIRNYVFTFYMYEHNYERKTAFCILKHNKRDAVLYNVLYCCQCCTCFGRFLRSSPGAQKLYMKHRYLSNLCVVTVSLVESELRLNQANGNNAQV
jgi:hypothetical protein